MIHSMTGFGRGRGRAGDEEITVEIRSVNHKYCEVKPRMPQELAPLEAELVRRIKDTVRRGALEVTVRRSATARSTLVPRFDLELARELVRCLDEAAQQLSLARNLGIAELAQFEGLVTFETRSLDPDAAREALRAAVDEALAALVDMRRREGEALAQDLLGRLVTLRESAERIRVLSPETVEHYRARLEERAQELSRGLQIDPQRLAQEVALFADRVDIAEELTRLGSHLAQFEQLATSSEPAGRRMDFLIQEINREVNTTGSKSQSAEIAQLIVSMKAEIERLREQVQNVE
jgi:uncharacterized protein (TIGR00255 family)